MKTKRCGRCGNEIPGWSGGVCPVCDRVMPVEKRYWKGGRKRLRPRVRPASGEPTGQLSGRRVQRPKAKPAIAARRRRARVAKTLFRPRSQGRRRLKGFNRLLQEVYGRPVRLSHLLTKQGVSRNQVAHWRQDGLWLLRFLKRLEGSLLTMLAEALPGHDPRVLTRWYGLDGRGTRPVRAIAAELESTTIETQFAHDLLLRYLRRHAVESQVAF